jgi:hypothetical protein
MRRNCFSHLGQRAAANAISTSLDHKKIAELDTACNGVKIAGLRGTDATEDATDKDSK